MLVLSRKRDESIVIGDNITIKVVEVKGNRIRLAISAPRDVPVRRGELEPFFGVIEAEAAALEPTAV
ncbi:MAG: carbon storage regulator [Pirellulaceae bacterium]